MKNTIAEKERAVEAIGRQIKESPAVYFLDYMGLTVEEANELRKRLRGEKVDYKVVKNTLVCRAIEKQGVDNKLAGYIKGPTAMAASLLDEATPARIITEFSKKQKDKLPRFKVGLVNGRIVTDREIAALASLPGRKELLGMLVSALAAPMTKFAGTLNAVMLNFAYAVNALKEKKEKEEVKDVKEVKEEVKEEVKQPS